MSVTAHMESKAQRQSRREIQAIEGLGEDGIILQQRIADLNFEFTKDRERKKRRKIAASFLRDTPEEFLTYEMWCDDCDGDMRVRVVRCARTLNDEQVISWRGRCPECDEPLVRFVTHRREDPYYVKSRMMRIQRGKYIDDVLQAGDYGFRMKYGDPFDAWHKRFEEDERGVYEHYRQEGLKGSYVSERDRIQKLNEE